MRLVAMRLAAGVAALSTCAATLPAWAEGGVAVAVTIAEEDASQRDLAGNVVSVARQKWRMLQPQLTASQTKGCNAGNTECLRSVAASARADYLLVVGVAPLGVRDRVVAVQLFDIDKVAPRFEESVVQSGLTDDLTDVKALAARLVAVSGPPSYVEPPSFVAVEPEPAGLGPLSIGGFILVGAGGVTVLTSAITGWGYVEDKDPTNATNLLLYGVAAGGALAALGTIAFAIDAL